jgi:glycosyltransferase involved in cell wall biosynthesis
MMNFDVHEQNLLSVIVPITRMTGRLENLERTFAECEKKQVEFILVHDEQDSSTHKEIEGLVEKFDNLNIRLFRETFNSPGLARNFGIRQSTGRWFCFSDADDLPQISNLIKISQLTEEIDAQVGIGSILVVNDKKELLTKSKGLEARLMSNIISFAKNPAFTRFVFKSDVFRSVEFPKIKMGEDQVYLSLTKFLDYKILFSDELLYIYFTNLPNQATKNALSLKELPVAIELLKQNLPNSSAQMRVFIEAQIMKVSVSCLKRRIKSINALQKIFELILRSPIKSTYTLFKILKAQSVKKE